MLGGFTPNDGQTFDIITTGDIADSSITNNATIQTVGLSTGSFSAAVVPGAGDSDILQLTYSASEPIPEPASLSLLSLGGLLLLRRRRTS